MGRKCKILNSAGKAGVPVPLYRFELCREAVKELGELKIPEPESKKPKAKPGKDK